MSDFSSCFDVFTPPPRYDVCEWADEHRYLSSESSAKPGKYRSAFAPYQRDPMKSVNVKDVQQVVLMFASQLGKTELMNNVVGYFIHGDPAPQLMVQPTIEFGESWSKERLVPMVRDTPVLAGLVKDARSRDSGNTILHKSYPGGNIAIVGANAPSGLAGRPRRVVLLDEVDRFPASAGTEGDPVSLAIRRTESFWNAIVVMTSTPTTKGASRIESAFSQTDQCMWFVPCHACCGRQVLRWSQVKWEDDNPENAWIECEHCQAKWTDAQRHLAVLAGEWRPTAPFNGKRGYWLNGINSPFKHKRGFKNRLHQMVADFIEAKAGGNETLKTWVNTFLAETWEEDGDSISASAITGRLEDYGPALPDGVMVLTLGADVQKDRIEAEIVGWGEGEESWGIETGRFIGDTEKPEVWEHFREFCLRRFVHPQFGEFRVERGCVDAGHNTPHVYRWCRENPDTRVVAVMGARTPQRQPVSISKRRNAAMMVDTSTFKSAIYARLRMTTPGPRFMHYPRQYDDEYFEQLTAERMQTRYVKGFPKSEWVVVRGNKRNEALDIRVYNHAALWLLQPNWLALKTNLAKTANKTHVASISNANAKPQPVAAPALLPSRPAPGPRRGGFVQGWRR